MREIATTSSNEGGELVQDANGKIHIVDPEPNVFVNDKD